LSYSRVLPAADISSTALTREYEELRDRGRQEGPGDHIGSFTVNPTGVPQWFL